jgi:hypothetical protein
MAPVWYFAHTVTIDEITTSLDTYTIHIFDYNKLNEVRNYYQMYGKSFDLTLSKIFLIFAIVTMISSLNFVILTILTLVKRLPTYNKLPRTCKVFSCINGCLALISLIIALIFSITSTSIIADTDEATYTLSINITTGIYLFIIFEIAGAISGYIGNDIKDD